VCQLGNKVNLTFIQTISIILKPGPLIVGRKTEIPKTDKLSEKAIAKK
jgi:hypothetical protein